LTQTLAQQMQAQAQLLARMGLLSDLRDGAQAEMAPRSATSPVADPTAPAVPQVPVAPAVPAAPALPSVLVTPLPN